MIDVGRGCFSHGDEASWSEEQVEEQRPVAIVFAPDRLTLAQIYFRAT